jgi:signal transduction histidine kinase
MTTTHQRFGTVAEVTSRRRLQARTGTLIAIDAVVAVVAIVVSWAILSADSITWPAGTRAPDGLSYMLVVAANAPIALRRRAWGAALAIALVAELIYAARQYPPFLAPAVPLIVYSAATRLDDRRSRVVLVVAAVASWIGATAAAGATDPQSVLIVGGAWLLGHYVRTRRLLVAELQQRAVDLEREREERAMRAVAEERLRIARELHDVLAHTMSVVAVQAGTGRVVGPDHPGEAIKALAAVEETARSAMHEMRQLLTVLRTDDDTDASVTPTPGLEDLAALVAQVTEAGIDVAVRVEGEPWPIPAGVGLAAYRIIQEALTNVIKHAGPAHASVLVRYTDHDVTVEVRDDGHATAAPAGAGGHGLIGMRERAAVHGGELIAGPAPAGGFQVRARLPLGTVEP